MYITTISTLVGLILMVTNTSLALFKAKRTKDVQKVSSHTFSLDKRYRVPSVNEVFKDNILLNIAYIVGRAPQNGNVDWAEVKKPFRSEFTIAPKETFAYHNVVLDQYKGKNIKAPPINFGYEDGFKSDGYLVGDGVCHLASFMYLAAKSAGLDAVALTRHDFAPVPEIPREYGVSIFSGSSTQNLYITNTKDTPVKFVFEFDGVNLKTEVVQSS